MRIGLVDSGLGALSAAAALRRMRPDADLVLSTDPDGMPWGLRPPEAVAERVLAAARAAAGYRLDVLVVACNTASVHALERVRDELEPALPVVGTVPAIKPAAAASGGPLAIWATPATTGSAYQRDLIERFAAGATVAEVACPGLAAAVETAELAAITSAIDDAAGRTPAGTRAVVIGCTHYDLVADRIRAALPAGTALYDSPVAVATQALRRAGSTATHHASRAGSLTVLESGRVASLPPAALAYPAGRLLAGMDAPV